MSIVFVLSYIGMTFVVLEKSIIEMQDQYSNDDQITILTVLTIATIISKLCLVVYYLLLVFQLQKASLKLETFRDVELSEPEVGVNKE